MFDIIGKRNWFFLFSGLIVVPGLIFIILTPLSNGKMGLQFSIDYTGGTVWQFEFKDPNVTLAQVEAIVTAQGIKDFTVTEDTNHTFTLSTKQTNLVPAPTFEPTLAPSVSASVSAAAASAAQASAQASAAASNAVASASASAANASASASAAAAAATPNPSASITAAPTASPSAAASASASASAGPSASATLPPNTTASTHQDGTACTVSIPNPDTTLGKLAIALQDPKTGVGKITCTGIENSVGPVISSELITQAIELIIFGSVGILLWMWVRFRSIKFGATALAALIHDVIVVVGSFAILGTFLGVQVDALFVTAMLTIIGFSVHDTIVVYDRIRENKTRHAGEPFDQIVNHSILQTFGRSINTSLTVVMTLFALLIFAGASIKYFILALLIGIISGTYSSIFNASPLLVIWQLWDDRRRAQRLAALRGRRA